jgi:endothelin-converting enzyme/putative endopeptidase
LDILQEPVYSKDYPSALNYGILGSLFGRALGHLLDQNGIQYDSRGRLTNWLDVTSRPQYDAMLKCVKEQYDGYCETPKTKGPNLCVSGDDTLNENLAGQFLLFSRL